MFWIGVAVSSSTGVRRAARTSRTRPAVCASFDVLVVLAQTVEALVDAREHLVRLVDDAQIELVRQQQSIASRCAAGGFAPDQEHAIAVEAADCRRAPRSRRC